MNAEESLPNSEEYDPYRVSDFFDAYGLGEWERLFQNPSDEVVFHLHDHYLRRYIEPGQRVLEIGAGPGRFTQVLGELGARVVVADISRVQLKLNRLHARKYGFASAVESWLHLDICDMSRFPAETFDRVVAYGGPFSYVLSQRDTALRECRRVLKPGGFLLLSVISLWGSAHRHLDRVLSTPVDANRLITETGDILPETLPNRAQYFHMFRSEELWSWLEGAGLEVHIMSASDCLSTGWGEMLKEVRGNPDKWQELLRMELEACAEPGSLNMGMHIIAVGRKDSS